MSSAFSFHCMICFEEFDPQTNYPVVLPCGHTYVCIQCANRLDKCMECRTPLTTKIEFPPPPPPVAVATPGTPGPSRAAAGGGGGASPDVHLLEKENYADRVRNSPGFRRRYGHRLEYSSGTAGKRGGGGHGGPGLQQQQQPQPPPQAIKQRLPLPKNAVLLSLIQASEPARRRAEVEAPPTPQKEVGAGRKDAVSTNAAAPAPPSRPSPFFLDRSSSGEGHACEAAAPVGSLPDDEEHKIRVGTYLEGGPCGTYAVAVKGGLLVYPTLFEHTLPSALSGVRQGEEDEVKRDVEELVKKHRASAGTRMFPGRDGKNGKGGGLGGTAVTPTQKKKREKKKRFDPSGSPITSPGAQTLGSLGCGTNVSPVDTELGVSRTWVEIDNIEAQCGPSVEVGRKGDGTPLMGGEVSPLHSPVGAGIPMADDVTPRKGADVRSDPGGTKGGHGGFRTMPRLGSIAAMAAAASEEAEDEDEFRGLSVSLTISDESDEDGGGNAVDASARTLPARRSSTVVSSPRGASPRVARDDSAARKFARHFSQGSYPKFSQKKEKGASSRASKVERAGGDEFDRPLIRLKYGDRVQVVSMDSRGWVKLARGYGYIRLENDKQLVKVGGTSDKACQIEAMLHELSIERNRLKHEQTKLERLSAGLMIDLGSSLITSDDNVVVPAPEGSLRRIDSELSISLLGSGRKLDTSNPSISLDDIDVSARTRTALTPPRSADGPGGAEGPSSVTHPHRQIRTAKSHSPGRTSSLPTKGPPSPPYGQVGSGVQIQGSWSGVNTPTRVNFRTGLSGHRALTSSHAHPHDFIANSGYGTTIRSMSNHAGISSSKKTMNSRGRSIY